MNKSTGLTKSKKKKSKSKAKLVKHKKKGKSQNGNEDSDSALSPDKEIHSISHYVNDRPEMLEQMFSTMSEEKLRAMLPPLLKDETMDNLRANCLEVLLGMSSKRVKSVINGDDLGSQSSETDDSSIADTTSSDDSDEETQTKLTATVSDQDTVQQTTVTANTDNEGQSLLEIVELQLRARAIRAALEHQCASEPPSPDATEDPSTNQDETIVISDEETVPRENARLKEPVKKEIRDDYEDCALSKIHKPGNSLIKDDSVTTAKRTDDKNAVVFSKSNISGPSKRNVIVIGPSKKPKNKIVCSKKSIRVIDTSKSTNEPAGNENGEGDKAVIEENKYKETEVSSEASSKRSGELLESSETEKQVIAEEMNEASVKEKTVSRQIIEDSQAVDQEVPTEESWVGRWLQQPQNQAAKKNSKIIGSIKQKLRTAAKKNTETAREQPSLLISEPVAEALVLLGTVNEYDLLPSTAVVGNASSSTVVTLDETIVNDIADRDIVLKASLATDAGVEGVTVSVEQGLPSVPRAGDGLDKLSDLIDKNEQKLGDTIDESDGACLGDELEIHYQETEDEMQS